MLRVEHASQGLVYGESFYSRMVALASCKEQLESGSCSLDSDLCVNWEIVIIRYFATD